MDEVYQQIISIATLIIGSADIASIIGVIIYVIRAFVIHRKEIAAIKDDMTKALEINKQQVENAFKEAILPKNIRLDVSSKIEKPIKDGLQNIQLFLQQEQERIDKGQQLILAILSQFTHVKKLPEETQKEIDEYLEAYTVEEIKIE